MPNRLVILFLASLSHSVFSFVPSPTNLTVYCHNFENFLYWNYSGPTEQLQFIVSSQAYVSDPQTNKTSHTYLNVTDFMTDVEDNYIMTVKALVGKEESESISIGFTYGSDLFNGNTHMCSVDFPALNTSVLKDVIYVSFLHPYNIYDEDIMKEKEFIYTVKHDHKEEENVYECFNEDELCTAEIHLKSSLAGHCIELYIKGTIGDIAMNTVKNVCGSVQVPETGFYPANKTGYISALVGGGIVVLFGSACIVWVLCKKWSKIPKIPEVLFGVVTQQRSATTFQKPEKDALSTVTATGHTPLLEEPLTHDTSIICPTEQDSSGTFTHADTEVDVQDTSGLSDGDVNCEESEGYGRSSDYDSPKFLQEMSPGDFTEGYGARPAILSS